MIHAFCGRLKRAIWDGKRYKTAGAKVPAVLYRARICDPLSQIDRASVLLLTARLRQGHHLLLLRLIQGRVGDLQ